MRFKAAGHIEANNPLILLDLRDHLLAGPKQVCKLLLCVPRLDAGIPYVLAEATFFALRNESLEQL